MGLEWRELTCRKLNYVLAKVNTEEKRAKFSGFATMAHDGLNKAHPFFEDFDISAYRGSANGAVLGPKVDHCRPTIAPLGKWYNHFIDADLDKAKRIGVLYNG